LSTSGRPGLAKGLNAASQPTGVRLEEIVFLAGTELRAACWVITNRSVLPLRLTALAITRAPSLMAGLADAQIALAINQLSRQAATPFSNLDILRITIFFPA